MKLPTVNELSEFTLSELYILELRLNMSIKGKCISEQTKQQQLLKYGIALVLFIEDETTLLLRTQNNQRDIVCIRSIIYNHLLNKGMSKSTMGTLFRKHRTTVLHSLRLYKSLEQIKDESFIKNQYQITKIIESYDKTI